MIQNILKKNDKNGQKKNPLQKRIRQSHTAEKKKSITQRTESIINFQSTNLFYGGAEPYKI